MKPPTGYAEATRYPFTDERGTVLFEKIRFRAVDERAKFGPKTFRYFNPNALPIDQYKKPARADDYIYNLPEVLGASQHEIPVHWTEGEKDADALSALCLIATSVHQGANKVTREQAAWLRGAAHVVVWVDKDEGHPEVGAHDAVMRHDLMRATGMRGLIEFRCARGPWGGLKDISDHLAAGYTVDQARVVNPAKLVACARRYSVRSNRKAGYDRA